MLMDRFELPTVRVSGGCSDQLSYISEMETEGFEPSTFCLQGRYSPTLSYVPKEPMTGIEPATLCLQGTCASNYATPAKLRESESNRLSPGYESGMVFRSTLPLIGIAGFEPTHS